MSGYYQVLILFHGAVLWEKEPIQVHTMVPSYAIVIGESQIHTSHFARLVRRINE